MNYFYGFFMGGAPTMGVSSMIFFGLLKVRTLEQF